jgi:16S rRNA (guanine1207-N2)-methyltransferase
VIPSDAGDTVEGNFDTIWCNPPFHQGFAIDEDMSAKFLKATKRLLAPEGHALFVVNTFIPLEKKALKYFRSVQALANNGSFKLIALRN